jgi:hypothetical protein
MPMPPCRSREFLLERCVALLNLLRHNQTFSRIWFPKIKFTFDAVLPFS